LNVSRSEKEVGEGEGGKNEDAEYFDLLPNIWLSAWLGHCFNGFGLKVV
jgi:hypothetical protein